MSEHPAAGPRYASTTAFLAALTVKVNASARTRGVTATTLRRQYLLERFLARVFTDPEGGWVLKGGTGLLMRLPVARYSRDLDLAHTTPHCPKPCTPCASRVPPFRRRRWTRSPSPWGRRP